MIKTHGEYCGPMCPYFVYDRVRFCYACEKYKTRYGKWACLHYDYTVNQIKRCAACKKENP